MKIHLNGKEINISPESTLLQLIENQGFAGRRLAAEVNLEIIAKAEHAHYKLSEGDHIEIVHAIGGG